MLDKLKADFDEILELVAKCPDPLRDTALKTILDNWFKASVLPPPAPATPFNPASSGATGGGGLPPALAPFAQAHSVTLAELGKVYHPVGAGAQLAISAMPGSSIAVKEVGLACLLSVRQALDTGAFSCTLKALREMCAHFNCYDAPNFSKNLSQNKSLFKPRGKGADLELSGAGMKKAADLIKSIAAGA